MNRVILTGHLENISLINIKFVKGILVTTHKYTDKKTGKKTEEIDKHDVIFFDKLAELIRLYGKIGYNILIEGFIKTGKEYTRDDGVRCVDKDIIVRSMEFLHPVRLDGNRL
jgi:single-strand DNA-binding protein